MPKTGQAHHNAKLTDGQVIEMRRLWAEWKDAGSRKGYSAMAELFGCGASTVRDIVQYRTRYNVVSNQLVSGDRDGRLG